MSVVRVLGALLLAWALVSPAHAADHDPGLVLLLSQIHDDPTPEALERFEPDLGAKLAAVAGDPAVIRLARVRALSTLGRIGDDRAFEVVSAMALDPGAPVRLRLAAIATLGRRFEGRPGRVDAVAAVLTDRDAGVREHAVRALAAMNTEGAWGLIEAHRFGERHAAVRRALREVRVKRLGLEGMDLLPPEGRGRSLSRRAGPQGVTR